MASWMNPDTGQMMNYGQSPSMIPGIGGLLQGAFGNSGSPYQAGGDAYTNAYNESKTYQNPFYQEGVNAIPQFQQYNQTMSDPSGFINKLMGSYQSSPYADFMQKQAQRANTNSASASGLIGSTPFQQSGADYAHQISQQDMGDWLNRVLGINTAYGTNLNTMVNRGANSANMLSQSANQYGQNMASAAFGQQQGQNSDFLSGLGGIASLFFK